MKKFLLLVFIVILADLISIIVYKRQVQLAYNNNGTNSQSSGSGKSGQQQNLVPAINGFLVSPAVAAQRPITVMVENHPDARPQSGLIYADIVYEVLAEGGITRFEAVYQTDQAPNIGPVRSARDYFAEIANELGAIYAHVGGSDQVIQQLASGYYPNISDENQYYNGDYFQRVSYRPAPHNVYTSFKQLWQLAQDKDFSLTASYAPWVFKDDGPASTTATNISMSFSTTDFDVSYVFNTTTDSYERFLAGQPHVDAQTGQQIAAKDVVVQLVPVTEVPNDPLKHVDIDVDDGGQAVVFEDGGVIQGTWTKQNNRTRFYDSNGQQIALNRGQIWVELVPTYEQSELTWN
jgi:hypothetical protein